MEKTNRRVYIRLTNKCNQACEFCYFANDPKPLGMMPEYLAREIIDRELEMHVEDRQLRVILSGGEPTLHPELASLIRELTANPNLQIVLETNGTTLDTFETAEVFNYFKHRHFLKISIYSNLMTEEYCTKLIKFINFAKQSGVRYILNPRFKDKNDRAKLAGFIEENNLAPENLNVYYYPLSNCNFYEAGALPTYDFSFVIYDYDGSTMMWYNHTPNES